jgi:hypothetical protein
MRKKLSVTKSPSGDKTTVNKGPELRTTLTVSESLQAAKKHRAH